MARSSGRLVDPLYDRLHLAKEVQLHMWISMLQGIAEVAGGRMTGGIDIDTRRLADGDGGTAQRLAARIWGWPYQTLEGYIEQGEMSWEVLKWRDVGGRQEPVHGPRRPAVRPAGAVPVPDVRMPAHARADDRGAGRAAKHHPTGEAEGPAVDPNADHSDKRPANAGLFMGGTGLEPVTSCLSSRRSPS